MLTLLRGRARSQALAIGGGLPRTFWVLWGGMFVNRAGSFVVPFLAIYLTQVRHTSIAQAGLVAAIYGAGSACASPLGGFLADRIGRRATMVGALGFGGLGMMSLGFAHDLRVIAPMCFVVALFGEAYRPAMQAAVADLVPPAERVRAFGLLYWVINLGFSIGLFVGGLLATASFTLLFVGDGFTSLAFAFIVWRAVPETREVHGAHAAAAAKWGLVRGFLAPYRDRPYLAFVLLSILILLVFMQHTTTFPIDMTSHGVSRAAFGSVLAINGVLIVLVQPFLAPLIARRNRSHVLAVGTALVALGFGMNAFAHAALAYGAGVIVWTLGEICVLPVANAVVADIALPELRGRYQGAYGLSFGLAGFVAPLVGSYTMQRWGSPALWFGCLALGLLVALGHLALAPRLTRLREARIAAHAVPAAGGR